MRRLIILWAPLALLLAMILLFSVDNARQLNGPYPQTLVDQPLPEFHLNELQTNKRLSTTDFIGEVSLLNIWASWCSACVNEHGILNHVAKFYKVPVYGIDYKDRKNKAEIWLKEYGNPYSLVGYDPKGNLKNTLGVDSLPKTYVLDKHGFVRHQYKGPITPELWQQQIWPKVEELRQEP